MNAVNALQLFSMVLSFTAVCQADDDVCSVSCDDVTGTVGSEVTLTCRVSQKCTDCCITNYKFQYPKPNDSEICEGKELSNNCSQRNTFTCSFTPTTAMNETFRFFLQTKCGFKKKEKEFTVIAEPSSVKGGPESTEPPSKENGIASNVVASIIIIVLIIILTTILFKKGCFGFVGQKMFQGIKQDKDNPDNPVKPN